MIFYYKLNKRFSTAVACHILQTFLSKPIVNACSSALGLSSGLLSQECFTTVRVSLENQDQYESSSSDDKKI